MDVIHSISLSRLNQGAHYNYHFQLLGILEKNEYIKEKFAQRLDHYKKAVQREDLTMISPRKSLVSGKIEEADKKRLRLFNAFKKAVDAFAVHPDGETVQAYRRMHNFVKGHHISRNSSVDTRTGWFINLTSDLESLHSADVARLNVGWIVNEMKVANLELIENVGLRNEEESKKLPGQAKSARRLTDRAYGSLISFVNAHLILDDGRESTRYASTVERINAHILRYKLYSIRQRAGRPSYDPSATGPGEDTPTPPPPPSGGSGTAPDPSD